jgi:cytochrome d ubiquinol oxidase subunit I
MIGIGFFMVAAALYGAFLWWRGTLFETRAVLWMLMLAIPFPYIANEAGWVVAEVGRQPWVVYGLLLPKDALTTAGGVPVTLTATILIYGVLTGTTLGVPLLMSRRWRQQRPDQDAGQDAEDDDAVQTPYGPKPRPVEEMPA